MISKEILEMNKAKWLTRKLSPLQISAHIDMRIIPTTYDKGQI